MRYLFLILLSATIGCNRITSLPKIEDKQPPIEVNIPQSFVSDGKLHVKVSLKPLVNLKANQVAVDLVGVINGIETVKSSFSLDSIVPAQVLVAGVPLVKDFEIAAENLTEYKVICRWNNEGVTPSPIIESKKLAQNTGKLELLDQTIVRSDCKVKGVVCERNYKIQANLRNTSSREIKEIFLALEIRFIPNGLEVEPELTPSMSPLTADEQEVKLDGLTLSPNESRPIEVNIPDALVEIPDGMFLPRIRLYSYQ